MKCETMSNIIEFYNLIMNYLMHCKKQIYSEIA